MNKDNVNSIEEIEYDLKDEFKKIIKPNPSTIFIVIPLFITGIFSAIYMSHNNFQMISLIFVFFFLSLASIQDFQEKMVFEFLLYPIALSSLFFLNTEYTKNIFLILQGIGYNFILGTILVFFIYLISFVLSKILKKDTLGVGDLPIFFAFMIILNIYTSIGLLIMSASALIYISLTKEKEIPLIPFLYIGLVLTYIYIYLLEIEKIQPIFKGL